jgi:diguanylate cyclase (GGDEF)-like protein
MTLPTASDLPPPDLSPLLQAVARWVRRVGVQRATAVLVGLSVVASEVLTVGWHLLAGWPLRRESLVIAALVPVPIASLCAGQTLHLIMALDQAMRRLEDLAMTDARTGVHNRRWFMQIAALEFERAMRHDRPMAVVLIDVDHFTRSNDRQGRDHGDPPCDQPLIAIARTCQGLLRKTDVLARFGDAEFIVLLPETGQREAVRLAERMRNAVATDLRLPDHPWPAAVAIHLGVAALSRRTPTLDAFLQAAGQARDDTRRAGRDGLPTLSAPVEP